MSGHLRLYRGKRGSTYYAVLQLPSGRRRNLVIGKHWSQKGRPPAGFVTRRGAEKALRELIVDAGRGDLPGFTQATNATFRDSAEEWFEWGEGERGWKPSTRRDYRSVLDRHLLPAFGDRRLEEIDARSIERWRATQMANGKLPRRQAIKTLAIMHGVFERARKTHGLRSNPAVDVEKLRERYDATRFAFYVPEEVAALMRHAESEQDAALFATLAYSGLRLGEALALKVADVDFEHEVVRVHGSVDPLAGVGVPKSGKGRAVPLAPQLAEVLARLLQRDVFVSHDDYVFVNEVGRYLDGSALRRRYKRAQAAAGLKPIRLHDLRHSFASQAVNVANPVTLQRWLGHASLKTSERYLHYRAHGDEAALLGRAFAVETATLDALRNSPVRVVESDEEAVA